MRVCLIQTKPKLRQENLRTLSQIIQKTDADIYVLPELFMVEFPEATRMWPQIAEPFPTGRTYQLIRGFLGRRNSVVICGMPEKDDSKNYNIAALIRNKGNEAPDTSYRQKNTAACGNLPISRGTDDYGTISLSQDLSIGLMVCSDHFIAEEFFRKYKDLGANAVVLVAQSAGRPWIRQFPSYCQNYGLAAIVCNAAGDCLGGSCVINEAGQFLQCGERQFLSEDAQYAIGPISGSLVSTLLLESEPIAEQSNA
jgi:predicted amidohydrolase